MISKLSLKTANYLVKNNTIHKFDVEVYNYAFFMIYSSIIFFILTIIFGLIFGSFLESLIFYFLFFSIRIYAGGYHASTEEKCMIISSVSVLFSIIAIKISEIYDMYKLLFILSLISAVSILFFCPLDTQKKELSKKERKRYFKISLIVLIVILIVSISSYFKHLNVLFFPSCISLVLENVLLIVGYVKKIHVIKL